MHEVGARETAEHGRREADARFRAVFADAAIGIGDLDGRIIYMWR